MPADLSAIFEDSIARGLAVDLALPSAGLSRNYRTRFLARQPADATPHPDPALAGRSPDMVIQSVSSERFLIDELIANGKTIELYCRGSGGVRIACDTRILRRIDRYQLANGSEDARAEGHSQWVEALVVTQPATLQQVQRRNAFRVTLTETSELGVRAWRISDHAQLAKKPPAAAELQLRPRDISAGGLGATVMPAPPTDAATAASRPIGSSRITDGERVRLELAYAGETLLIDARARISASANGNGSPGIVCGIQFKKLESDIAGRKTLAALNKILGELQRAELRRIRIGLAKAS